MIGAEGSQLFDLTLSAVELPAVQFRGELVYLHDGVGAETHVPIVLDVLGGPQPPSHFDLLDPTDGDTVRDVTDVTFYWRRSIDPNPEDVVSYLAWFMVGEDSVSVETIETELTVDLTALDLPLEEDAWMTWWVEAHSGLDIVECNARISCYAVALGVESPSDAIPLTFGLQEVYPNPFNAQATIRFGIDLSERTMLRVFDLTGREVELLFDRTLAVGYHQVVWDASRLPTSLYIVRLEAQSRSSAVKLMLIR